MENHKRFRDRILYASFSNIWIANHGILLCRPHTTYHIRANENGYYTNNCVTQNGFVIMDGYYQEGMFGFTTYNEGMIYLQGAIKITGN